MTNSRRERKEPLRRAEYAMRLGLGVRVRVRVRLRDLFSQSVNKIWKLNMK